MPHDKRLTRWAGFFADLVAVVFMLVLLLWGSGCFPGWCQSSSDEDKGTLPAGIVNRRGKLSCQVRLPSGRTWRALPTTDPLEAAGLKSWAQSQAKLGRDVLSPHDDSNLPVTGDHRPEARPETMPARSFLPPGQDMPFMGVANGESRVRIGELFDRFLAAGAPDKHDHPLPRTNSSFTREWS